MNRNDAPSHQPTSLNHPHAGGSARETAFRPTTNDHLALETDGDDYASLHTRVYHVPEACRLAHSLAPDAAVARSRREAGAIDGASLVDTESYFGPSRVADRFRDAASQTSVAMIRPAVS